MGELVLVHRGSLSTPWLLRLRRRSIAVGHLLPCLWVARRCWWWRPRRSGRARHGDSPRSLGSRWGHPARWKEPPPQGDLWPPRKGHSRGTRGPHHRGGDPWRNRSHGGDCRGTPCDSGNRTTGCSWACPMVKGAGGCTEDSVGTGGAAGVSTNREGWGSASGQAAKPGGVATGCLGCGESRRRLSSLRSNPSSMRVTEGGEVGVGTTYGEPKFPAARETNSPLEA